MCGILPSSLIGSRTGKYNKNSTRASWKDSALLFSRPLFFIFTMCVNFGGDFFFLKGDFIILQWVPSYRYALDLC